MKYSVIIPVFNEEQVLKMCYDRLKSVMDSAKQDYELVFVNDGSRDDSLNILKQLAKQDKSVKVVSFSRNFGHQTAVTAGMKECGGDAVVIIDCDLQDPPEVILEMIEKWKEGYDIVYGQRLKRKGESVFKKVTAKIYYRLVKKLSSVPVALDTGDFRLIDRKVVDTLNAMPEHNRFLRGMNSWVGYNQTAVKYERDARAAGETKYTMKKMVKLASDGIISSSNSLLSTSLTFGLWLLILSALTIVGFGITDIIHACGVMQFSFGIVAYIFPVIGFFTAIVLLSNGITGAYLGRVYDEVKARPHYIISEKINF